jgi:hypothetical protein
MSRTSATRRERILTLAVVDRHGLALDLEHALVVGRILDRKVVLRMSVQLLWGASLDARHSHH